MVIETVDIISNEQIAVGIWRMSMHAPQVAGAYKGPGQFINLLADDSWDHLVRRPMSIASVNSDEVDIIYKIFGETTDIFSRKKSGPQGCFHWSRIENSNIWAKIFTLICP